MKDDHLQNLIDELIDKGKWHDFLKRFIDVLWMNIFVVDYEGQMIIPPYHDGERGRYGSKFFSNFFGFDFSGKGPNLLKEFVPHGHYLEYKDPFDFRTFAIPIRVQEGGIIAYLIVGPVILNKRWSNDDYINVAGQLHLNMDNLIDSIHEIRVVSFVTIKAILDLLCEVVKDIVELSLERRTLHHTRFQKDVLPEKMTEAAQDIFTKIHLNELLVTILDVALNLTQAECGSIMTLDDQKDHLTIKVSRGLDEEKVKSTQLRMGEGIAGIAAEENTSFIISGTQGESRIQNLLKRPNIKTSAVLPLVYESQVLGVLNVHTKGEHAKIKENVANLQYLSKLITAAIKSI